MQAETTYNWDDLEVGRFDLNHSENFFTQKHFKHEKFSEEFHLLKAMAATNLNESFSNEIAIKSEKQEETVVTENKENTKPVTNKNEIKQTTDAHLSAVKEQVKLEIDAPKAKSTAALTTMAATNLNESFSNEIAIKSEKQEETVVTENKENTKPVTNKNEIKQTTDAHLSAVKEQVKLEIDAPKAKSTAALTTSNSNRRPANLMTRPKTPQPEVKSIAKGKAQNKVEPPHVYDFQAIYQKKKEEKMKKLLEEEKKNRIFHSRPVPKSVLAPRDPLAGKEQALSKLTIAKTPVVVKNSREALEKRRQRLEEWKKNHPPVQFTSREPAVLHEEPFKPKKLGQTVQIQPFNLHVERRLGERKHYDEHQRRINEEKKKQEEEERKKRDEELVKEIRKLASFKARPNPFK